MLDIATTHASLLIRLAAPDGGGDGIAAGAAWREFEDRYGELIRGVARRRGLQPADADDVLQEVLLAVARNVGDGGEDRFRYDPGRGKFRSYLKTIAIRAISRKFRQNRDRTGQDTHGQAFDDLAADPGIEELWEPEWRQYHLRLAMRSLRMEFNQTDLAIFEAYTGEERDAAEVARELNVSTDRVYQAKSRILRRLRDIIAEQVAVEG